MTPAWQESFSEWKCVRGWVNERPLQSASGAVMVLGNCHLSAVHFSWIDFLPFHQKRKPNDGICYFSVMKLVQPINLKSGSGSKDKKKKLSLQRVPLKLVG